MGKDDIVVNNNDYAAQYKKNGQIIVNECGNRLQKLSAPIWQNKKDKEEKNNKPLEEKKNNIDFYRNNTIEKVQFSNFSHSANHAYTNLIKKENNLINKVASLSEDDTSTILNAGRLVETMESVEDAGKRHLSFLSEEAPESGEISGSANGYYEKSSNGSTSIFLGSVENRWQNKQKNIYTAFSASIGGQSNKSSDSQTNSNKLVADISFNSRLDGKNFIYGAGADYNAYSNSSEILDLHVSGKHKLTGIGADLTRRTTITKDDATGEKYSVSNMKLKLDIISNASTDKSENNSKLSFESGSSALPEEAVNLDKSAKELTSSYLKPDRKTGVDVDFEYNENVCGCTFGYNKNFVNKENKFLSVSPVIGLHDYTDPALDDNNESFEMTAGVITQFGAKTNNGQTFICTATAMADRLVAPGSEPSDSHYFLANAKYGNTKANLNVEVDAGALKSGDVSVKYLNLNAQKNMKNSSLELSGGISQTKIGDEKENLFNVMATYKYKIPYNTKK